MGSFTLKRLNITSVSAATIEYLYVCLEFHDIKAGDREVKEKWLLGQVVGGQFVSVRSNLLQSKKEFHCLGFCHIL